MKCVFAFLFALTLSLPALAKLKVVATTADIRALVEVVAADKAEVISIAKGSQDPHFIEAKPSFMVRIRDADLVVANGLSLEIGWLPNLVRGARNPKVTPGSNGYLDLGALVSPLDKPTAHVTRAQGDVHPDGNPHFTLDPIRNGELAVKIAERLGELDPHNKTVYEKNAGDFKERMNVKARGWQKRIDASGVKKVVTYHPTLNYFLARFGLSAPLFLEDKPGIPPSAKHIIEVIDTVKKEKIPLILVDNFFDTKIADRIAKESVGVRVAPFGIAVDSAPGLTKLEDVTEQLVKIIEGP